jgi:hypothetical protein
MSIKKKFTRDWTKAMDRIREQNTSNGGNSYKDERIYYPQFTEKGTAQAIIRFLPSKDTDIPFVSVYSHSVKGPGGYYIENCPTTLKRECPVCKANSSIWDSDPDTARSRKRKQYYYSNILVVKDPANPENEGKIFIYKYGKKVHDKIMEKIQPDEDSIEEPVMIFDYYDGADFKLILKKVKVGTLEMPNYDSCSFEAPSPIGTDEEIEKIDNSLYGLADFIAEENFKTYDELENKFNRVIGVNLTPSNKTKTETTKPEINTKVAEDEVFEGNDEQFFDDLKKED